MLTYFLAEGKPFAEYADVLPDTLNMYLFSKAFHWCSPDVYRNMDDWTKSIFLAILRGESDATEQINKENRAKTKSKKPSANLAKRRRNKLK